MTDNTIFTNYTDTDKLLTAEEEIALAKIVKAGGPSGIDARNKLVEANMRLVYSVARKYSSERLSFDDFCSMGFEGLIAAADHFDPEAGYRFSTYAMNCIRNAINKGFAYEGRTARIPSGMLEKINRISKVQKEFEECGLAEPSVVELAEATGLSPVTVRTALNAMKPETSLEATIGEDSTVMDYYSDDSFDPYNTVEKNDVVLSINKALKLLDEKEAKVIALRYGLNDGKEMTLEQVAKLSEFGVSKQRIRQIEEKAKKQLQSMPEARAILGDYAA